jgi:hypothetical protein
MPPHMAELGALLQLIDHGSVPLTVLGRLVTDRAAPTAASATAD